MLFIKRNESAGDATTLEAFLSEATPYPLRTLGSWDYVIFLGAKDEIEFYHLIRQLRNNFGAYISSFSTLHILKDVKFTFTPEGVLRDVDTRVS